MIKLLKNKFGNNFYLEIQRHGDLNEKQLEIYKLNLSKKYQIPIIATNEVYYLDKEMYEAHDALRCIGEKNFVEDKNRFRLSNQHFLKTNKDIIKM